MVVQLPKGPCGPKNTVGTHRAETLADRISETGRIRSGGPTGGHLKGGRLKIGFRSEVRTCKWDFALQFALDTSVLLAVSEGIPQGRRRLDREGAV